MNNEHDPFAAEKARLQLELELETARRRLVDLRQLKGSPASGVNDEIDAVERVTKLLRQGKRLPSVDLRWLPDGLGPRIERDFPQLVDRPPGIGDPFLPRPEPPSEASRLPPWEPERFRPDWH